MFHKNISTETFLDLLYFLGDKIFMAVTILLIFESRNFAFEAENIKINRFVISLCSGFLVELKMRKNIFNYC